ncbi:MAG TPA: S4 domain-containing protein [Gammaproteobacteria bacterium]|nr:S4 domain-containing protein [Gammaproteobacteria bacterium]
MHDPRDVRLDKWLWAARLFKTRALATVAVNGGKVHVNGARVKPAREVRLGDTIALRRGEVAMEVVVRGLSGRRGPASVALGLYQETEESRRLRLVRAESRRQAAFANPAPEKRPDKKSRRQIIRFTGKHG